MTVRKENLEDAKGIRGVYAAAFPEEERELVASLARDLFSERSEPAICSLVAEDAGEIVGHVVFSPVFESEKKTLLGYILAPLAVRPEWQKKGIGSALISKGVAILDNEVEVLLVYGDPNYYRRFGFEVKVAESYLPPYPLKFSFGWRGKRLKGGDARKEPVRIECVPPLSRKELW